MDARLRWAGVHNEQAVFRIDWYSWLISVCTINISTRKCCLSVAGWHNNTDRDVVWAGRWQGSRCRSWCDEPGFSYIVVVIIIIITASICWCRVIRVSHEHNGTQRSLRSHSDQNWLRTIEGKCCFIVPLYHPRFPSHRPLRGMTPL